MNLPSLGRREFLQRTVLGCVAWRTSVAFAQSTSPDDAYNLLTPAGVQPVEQLFHAAQIGRFSMRPVHVIRIPADSGEPLELCRRDGRPLDAPHVQRSHDRLRATSTPAGGLHLHAPAPGVFALNERAGDLVLVEVTPTPPPPIRADRELAAADATLAANGTCTAWLQAHLDAFARAFPGGRLRLGPGLYRSGSLRLPSRLTLELAAGARLVASDDPADFFFEDRALYREPPVDLPPGLWRNARGAFLWLQDCVDTHLTGAGIIDGNGVRLRERELPGNLHGIRLDRAQGCTVSGLQLVNTRFWALHVYRSADIGIDRLLVVNPHLHTTDGIDVDSSTRVRVRDCVLHSGDDCLVVKCTGMHHTDRRGVADIAFERHVCLSGATAMKIGTETWTPADAPEMRDIRFTDIVVLKQPRHDLPRIAAIDLRDHARIQRVTWDGIRGPACHRLLDVTIAPRNPPPARPGSIDGLVFRDVHCDAARDAVRLHGADTDHRLDDVDLRNVTVAGQPLTPTAIDANAFAAYHHSPAAPV